MPTVYKTNGGWNTFRITAKGPEVTVAFNDQVTVHMNNGQFKDGPIALQFGNHGKEPGGTIKWRKMVIKPL